MSFGTASWGVRSWGFPQPSSSSVVTVQFDATSTSPYSAALSTYSWNHITGSQTNRLLVVSVSLFLTGTVSSITYGGVALTNHPTATIVNGNYRSEIWYLVAPASGTGSIVVTLSASLTSIGSAESYNNVHQLTPIEATATASGIGVTASATVTTKAKNSVVLANLVASSASGVASAAGQTSRQINSGALGTDADADKGPITPAAATTLSWTGLGAADTWAVSAISLRSANVLNGLILKNGRFEQVKLGDEGLYRAAYLSAGRIQASTAPTKPLILSNGRVKESISTDNVVI